ncbi:MAG: chemotaxis protein CheC [Methanocalculus sp. MSAO_Arc1]|uniref:chemotaxis protein CheC n=1 Tax=Methanocalculus TaxID=71151 RepID=UPI000FED1D7C|nr:MULTISPECIES: chemotaxis protein CheC [unclassified Methanocalculus]MCP1661401.1 chemotaxis protein CheC [Methanocalculus sp. AMF5]RQD79707.1 MAG: chemotaxis protein CheC [Methanocalculus sp. MSAO_Arc1]
MEIHADDLDAIRELVNIGVGKAAGILSELTGSTIELRIPEVSIYSEEEFRDVSRSLGEGRYSAISLGFEGGFSGMTYSIFPGESAHILIHAVTGDALDHDSADTDVNSISTETLKEVGNILINGVMGSITNVLGSNLVYTLPAYAEADIPSLIQNVQKEHREAILLAETRMFIRSLDIEGKILIIMGTLSFETLISRVREMQRG